MIRFLELTLRNFLQFGNATTTVHLERPGTTLIVGEDMDNTSETAGSNGVGKSTIINALVYALYDKPISKIDKIDQLINTINKKNMEVSLTFIGDDGTQYKVHRYRKMKTGAEGNKVHFYVNGEDKTRVPNGDTNLDIEKAVGMSYDMFVKIVVFDACQDGFLNMKGPEQKAFIEDLFELTVVTERAEKLKKKIKDTKADFEFKQSKVDQLVKEHERHQVLIENAKKRVEIWTSKNARDIEQLFEQLEEIDGVDLEGEAVLHVKAAELKTKLQEQASSIAEKKRAVSVAQTALNKVLNEYKHLKDSKCPYCLQDFANTKQKMEELAGAELELVNTISEVGDQLLAVETDCATTKRQYEEAKALITVKDLEALIDIKNESKNIKRKIAELDLAVNPFTEPLQELIDTKLDPIDHADLNQVKKVLEHQQFLLKLLTKNDSFVRKNLVNKNLPILNKHLRKHLDDLGLPHVVEFTQDLEASISKMGNELHFGLLSNGQRSRLNFGLSIAFKDVRERLHGRTNIVVFDEVLDVGLDAPGVAACAQLIKKMARREGTSIYVISHREEISTVFDRKLVVTLSKNFSYIDQGEMVS